VWVEGEKVKMVGLKRASVWVVVLGRVSVWLEREKVKMVGYMHEDTYGDVIIASCV
jgi:hypothetical protein